MEKRYNDIVARARACVCLLFAHNKYLCIYCKHFIAAREAESERKKSHGAFMFSTDLFRLSWIHTSAAIGSRIFPRKSALRVFGNGGAYGGGRANVSSGGPIIIPRRPPRELYKRRNRFSCISHWTVVTSFPGTIRSANDRPEATHGSLDRCAEWTAK